MFEGVSPQIFKIAKVIPIFEDGQKTMTQSCLCKWTIPTLGNSSSVFEKIIHKNVELSRENFNPYR